MLLQARRIDEALKLCAARLTLLKEATERVQLLNEMADLALHHSDEPQAPIGYLSASIRAQPRQPRRLHMLAELYASQRQWGESLACYDAAAKLARDETLQARLMMQMAHILEMHLEDLDGAKRLIEQVISRREDHLPAWFALVRIERARRQWRAALQALERLERVAPAPEDQRQVRLLKLEIIEQGEHSTAELIDAAMAVLLYDPERLEAADLLREELVSQGRDLEIELLCRELVQRALREHASPPVRELFALARRLQLDDIASSLASVGRWLKLTSPEMIAFERSVATTRRRWPEEPIEAASCAGLLPEELDVAFLEIVRRASHSVLEACEPAPYAHLIKRKHRLTGAPTPAQQLARRWVELFGLTLREVYLTESLPMGSAVVWEGGVRLILDEQWRDESRRDRLLVALGTQLSAWSIGVGHWSSLERELQVALFQELMHAATPSWPVQAPSAPGPKAPSWFQRERFTRWVEQEGAARCTAYALELGGRLGARALPRQFALIELAMERLAAVVMPDLSQALEHTVRLGVERGSAQRPWRFLLTAEAARLRQQIGVTIAPEQGR